MLLLQVLIASLDCWRILGLTKVITLYFIRDNQVKAAL